MSLVARKDEFFHKQNAERGHWTRCCLAKLLKTLLIFWRSYWWIFTKFLEGI